MYIFLDESGNFTGDKDGYFIVGGFATGEPKTTIKAFRKWQHSKFRNKKLQYRTEVKFSDTRLTDDLRAKTLLYFTKQNLRIFYSFLKKENIPLEYRKKKSLETGHLYTEVVAKTLGLLMPTGDPEFRVYIDRRHLKSVSQAEFKETIRLRLIPELPAKAIVTVKTIDSTTNANIQITDWLCGALYRYHTGRERGEEFYNILHSNIVAAQELFKDYWCKDQTNPRTEAELGAGVNKKSPRQR